MSNTEKIALLVDSGCDIPKDIRDEFNIYSVPLKIIYTDGEFLDRVDITSKEILDRFSSEIPKTSLPDSEYIKNEIEKIVNDGYNKLVVCSISTGLSGTFNAIRLVLEDFKELEVKLIDTKNIGVGSGIIGILAANLIREGKTFNEISEILDKSIENTKTFFCVETLEYLKKGGRIGLVAGTIGEFLNLKPIISCNEDGVYYTVSKVRGRKKSLEKVAEVAKEFLKDSKKYRIILSHANAYEETVEIKKELEKQFTDLDIRIVELCPVLFVHVGPGLIGVAVQKLDYIK